MWTLFPHSEEQKQPSIGVLRKRCFKNTQQIYRRTPMTKCDLLCNFIEITLRHWCSPVNLLYIIRTPFPKNTLAASRTVSTTDNTHPFPSILYRVKCFIRLLEDLYIKCSKNFFRPFLGFLSISFTLEKYTTLNDTTNESPM